MWYTQPSQKSCITPVKKITRTVPKNLQNGDIKIAKKFNIFAFLVKKDSGLFRIVGRFGDLIIDVAESLE